MGSSKQFQRDLSGGDGRLSQEDHGQSKKKKKLLWSLLVKQIRVELGTSKESKIPEGDPRNRTDINPCLP